MQTLELDFLPLEEPKKQDPPKIHFTKFGQRIMLNRTFLEKTGLDRDLGKVYKSVRLACDNRKPLDWYLVFDAKETSDGIKSWEIESSGRLLMKNSFWVRQLLSDIGDGKSGVMKLISTEPISISDSCKAFAIITKS